MFRSKMAARSCDWWAWSCDQKITCDEYYIRAKFEVDRTNGVGLASTFRGEKKNNNNNNNNNNKKQYNYKRVSRDVVSKP